MTSWSPSPGCAKFETSTPPSRLEPFTASRSTLLSPPALSASSAPVSPPASSLFEVVSLIDSVAPKSDSTMK